MAHPQSTGAVSIFGNLDRLPAPIIFTICTGAVVFVLIAHTTEGFYVDSNLFPTPSRTKRATPLPTGTTRMLLGPFCGKPACQFINTTPGKARGVCADAYTSRTTVLVPDVHAYPGHIACDGGTNSEIVAPLILPDGSAIGVLDLDCLAKGGFGEEDRVGVERIAKLVVEACDW